MALSDGHLTRDQFYSQLKILEGPDHALAFLEMFRSGATARSGADPTA